MDEKPPTFSAEVRETAAMPAATRPHGKSASTKSGLRRFLPRWVAAVAVVASLGLVAFWSWFIHGEWTTAHARMVKAVRVQELRGEIVLLDELLTMSARTCAATGDLAWEDRYQQHVATLDEAIKEASRLIPEASAERFAAQTDIANQKLVEMELRSFELVRAQRRKEAADVLASDQYRSQKAVYAAGAKVLLAAMQEQIAVANREQQSAERRSILLTLAMAGILLVVWTSASSMLRRQEARTWRAEKRSHAAGLSADVAISLTRGNTMPEALQGCAQALVHHLDAALVRIWIFDPKENVLELQASAGMVARLDGPDARVPLGKLRIGRIAAERKPHWTNDVLHDPEISDPEWARREGMVAFAGYPLIVDAELVGVIVLFAKTALAESKQQTLGFVAANIAFGIGRRRADCKLAESQSRLQAILATVDDAIVVIDQKGMVQSFNRSAELIFGYAAAEVIGRNVNVLMPPPYHEEHDGYIRQYLATGAKKIIGIAREVAGRHKDGSTFPLELTVSETRIEGELLFTGVMRDISERKRLEEQFRRAQKMEAVGQLSAGIAHDFNNLLTVISGYVDMLLRNGRVDARTTKCLTEINKAADRAASLTRQLLAFSQRQVLAPRTLNLNELVLNMEKLLQNLVGEDVQLHTSLDKTIGAVLADSSQIEQVIMNLAVNARDAMPEGGKLTIETASTRLDETYANLHPEAKPGPCVMLAVSDTGCGMDANIKAHLFEPFFTTKGVGKGTGLGLATVYGIVKQSNGHITVYTEPGIGTTLKIYLPCVEAGQSSMTAADVAPPSTRAETILLVEDEDALRTVARFALEECGYTVLEASNGVEAIRVLEQQHKGPIDLVVTDVVMPELGGGALGNRLAAMRPNVKILYTSGYTDDAVIRHGILHAEVDFLQKPFSATTLADKVRSVLG